MKRALWLLPLGLLAGCERGMHDMYDQPRFRPGSASQLFADHSAARRPPVGTVAYAAGGLAQSSGGLLGKTQATVARPAITLALMRRGQERYEIYCAPCHGLAGDGDGLVAQRGFPAPPSYDLQRLRDAPDVQIFDAITNGYGVMYPYRDRIDTQDRWAIVAYVRALQQSRRMPADQLDSRDRAALDRLAPGSPGGGR
ncbi:MAG TPA: cytochrome c [Dyella sp.]|uniref:c-type cytochrome n=1 Tax=Dyella sp. TaxID=1869338 RepID=UPI002F95053D